MARQKGPVFITGTMDGICFYKMNGQYYARQKSTLSGKRVKKSPAFQLTMVHAGILAQASGIASFIYRSLPIASKKHALYRTMTGAAMQLLKSGMDAEAVATKLQEKYARPATPVKPARATTPAKAVRIISHWRQQRIQAGALCVTTSGLLSVTVPRRMLKKIRGKPFSFGNSKVHC